MRHVIAIALGLVVASSGCSHGIGASDPSPPPAGSVVANRVEEAPGDDGVVCGGKGECKDGDGKAGDTALVGDKVETVPVDGAPSRGPAQASITIVEFADYQCPFCVRAEASIQAVEQAHPGDVRLVFKNLPLPMHEHAHILAKAALAANEQGRFWEMHNRLFALTGAADRPVLDRLAKDVGLDLRKFDRDLDDPSLDARVDADAADAAKMEVRGTPTFFVNGRRIKGAQPPAVFEQAIARQ
jgi:protein-disulfide isomerase